MNNSLVIELQRLAAGSSQPITELLRYALLAAKKLRIDEFSKWATLELEGYPVDKAVPHYRQATAELQAINPIRGYIPFYIDDPTFEAKIRKIDIREPASSLAALLETNESHFQRKPSIPIRNQLLKNQASPIPFEPVLLVSRGSVVATTDGIRQTILDWSLKLEEAGIQGNDFSFSAQEIKAATAANSIHIRHFNGVIGNIGGSDVQQTITYTVESGNLSSLQQALKDLGLGSSDTDSLMKAINKDKQSPSSPHIGPQVSAWIGNIMEKSVRGTIGIGIEAAGRLIPSLIAQYYGIPNIQ